MPDKIVKKVKSTITKFKHGNFQDLPVFLRSNAASWMLLFVLAAVVAFLTTMSLQYIPSYLQDGMISSRDIKADRNYEIIDMEATNKFKQEAIGSIISIYDLDDLVAESIVERIRLAFANTRIRYEAILDAKKGKGKSKKPSLTEEESEDLKNVFSESLGVSPTPEQWKLLMGEHFDERAENFLIRLIRKTLAQPVVAERAALDAEAEKGIVIRKLVQDEETGEDVYREAVLKDVSELLSTDEIRELIGKLEFPDLEFRDPVYSRKIRKLAQELVEPNCSPNRTETQKRRDDAAANVKNVILKIKSGEMIIREGARYEPWHIKVLSGIKKEKRRGLYPLKFVGTFILVFLFITIPFYLAERFFRRVRPTRGDHFLMAFVGLSVIVIARISIMLAPAIQSAIFFNAPTSALYYAIPVAGGAMLIRMYLGAEITMVFAVAMSVLAGFLVEGDISFIAYYLISTFAAVIAVNKVDKRSSIIRAGAITGGVGAVTILGGKLIVMATAAESVLVSDMMWGMFLAFLGGIGCAIYTMIAAPIVESVSGYTSDIKLLELANLNHPLLRELILRAPVTYHHSHLVGVLGEAAAEAVGANALLVRVGAYYHDIGKMKKPQYFIENSKAGDNRHERLSPSMSALIVSAHVKDGLDMAVRAGIPRVISDMIPQHHGTRIMGFFYSKAKEKEDPSLGKVGEKDFKYPGPKPQTREAAILMLADVTEASVRALKEKSSTRIQQTVQRVINDIFAESQLDECDLTLRDLNNIAKSFMRILLGIYHQRIEYPKDESEKTEINIVDESSTREIIDNELASPPETGSKKD